MVLHHVAAVKRLPVHNHRADYIFWSFGTNGLIPCEFENRVPLKLVLEAVCGQCYAITLLHMNRLNQTEYAIFVSLMCSDLHS